MLKSHNTIRKFKLFKLSKIKPAHIKNSSNNDIKFYKAAEKMNYKDLADYMIENIRLDGMQEAVLNKTIEILFKLDEGKEL